MTLKRAALKGCAAFIPNVYRPPAGVLFAGGHIVAESAPPHVRHLLTVPSIRKFQEDLDFLCRRYRPLQLSELGQVARLPHEKASPSSFLLSFDDGLREVYDIIAPILRQKGIPAVFFINSATIDNKQLMWRHKISLLIERSKHGPERIPPQVHLRPGESLHARLYAMRFDGPIIDEIARFLDVDFDGYLGRFKPYLTSNEVLELSHMGFEFGAHSHSHPYFCEIALDEQKEQISTSVEFIRGLGVPCRSFAFPFHDIGVTASVFSHIADLNLDLSFGTSEARLDSIPFSFQRFSLDTNSSIGRILSELSVRSFVRRVTDTEVIHRT
jgi:peptidoglycan/xylan/chitin deacetylase (PgdA/CDA1 family)